MFDRFQAVASPWLGREARLAVGYSGGLDSTVLLDLLRRLQALQPFALSAFHLHHGLSPHAEHWLAHCAQTCKRWGLPFSFERADLGDANGESVETRARAARYAAYARLEADLVALGHHRDDQAETVLYRLARGTGVRGAAGMPRVRPLGPATRLWRPLLDEPRTALLAYAEHHGLDWIEDESNASDVYDRNYLRRQVLPALSARFPAAASALTRAAHHFAEAAYLADALARIDAGGEGPWLRLSIARIQALDTPRRRNLLRWFLAMHGLRLEEKQIELVLDQCLTAREDATPCLRVGEREVRRFRGEIWLARYRSAPAHRAVAGADIDPFQGWGGALSWRPAAGGLPAGMVAALEARPRQGGESLRLRQGGPSRPVKHLLQEAGIPPWLRDHWPLLWLDSELVAVAGIGVAAAHQAGDGELALQPCWLPDDWPDAPAWLIG